MARWTREHVLEISAVTFVVGLVLTLLSYVYRFADAPGFLGWYGGALGALPGAEPEGYNLWIMIIGTILLLAGGFYFGEQLVLRRRFERLIGTAKKSEFVSNRKEVDQILPRLPPSYRSRVKEKEASFRSTR